MKLYTSVALALLSCSDGLHGKYTKCYRGRLGKIPKRQKPLEDLTVQQSAQANEFLKSCNYKFIEKFMKDSKGKPEKRNSVLGAVGLKTAQDWESFTEHNLDDFEDEEVKEDMEKCVSRCNRRDEWADLRGKGYEERLEKHQKNPRRFKKPDFMCSKCISYLSANKLKHVSDLQWGIKPKPSRKTTTTQAPTTTYQPTTFDTTTEKTTTTKKPSRPVTKSKEVKCGLRNRYPLSAQEIGSSGFTNLWDPEYHGQAADKPHRFLNGNIIHGNESKVGEWPWQASFRLPGENQNFCGGSLIDSTTVLTAAHCVHEGNWGGPLQYEFTIALGWHVADGGQAELERQQPIIKVDPNTKKKEVVGYGKMSPYGTTLIKIDLDKGIGEVHAHPDYIGEDTDYDTNVHSPHDIAIVKLPSAVKYPEASDDGLWFNDHQLDRSKPIGTMVRPVCLPSPTSPRKVNELTPFTRAQQSRNLHDTLWITGYGKKEKVRGKQTGNWQINSKHLLEAYLGPISNKLCQREINKLAPDTVIWRKQICAFSLPLEDEPIDTCQGDSGGPLTVRLNTNNDLERQLAHLDGMAKYEEMQRMIDEGTVDLNSPDRYELVGITSWGYGCGEGTPGIYTRVSEYMDWIAQYSDSFQTLDD